MERKKTVDELDNEIIRYLQRSLPVIQEPFKSISERLAISEGELMQRIKSLQEQGIIRRIGAVLDHRNVGFIANAMVVWSVQEAEIERVGKFMSEQREVSHCYQRISCPGWEYNLYTMVHAKTTEACEQIIKRLSDAVAIDRYEVLYSVRELKKSAYLYFD